MTIRNNTHFHTILLVVFIITSVMHAGDTATASPRDGWDFKFRDFLIGAWWGPYASEEEMQLYKDAGFNIIMTGRYMANGNLNLTEEMVAEHLDLAESYGLHAFFDPYSNYTWSDTPQQTERHPVSLEELEWLYERFGSHPALVGFLLGDDQSQVTEQLRATTDFMRGNCPHLMPWICQNIFNPDALVELGNPIADWQMYPTLSFQDLTAMEQMQLYCGQLTTLYQACRNNDLIMWPMFNVVYVNSDNVIRFQVFSSIAYASKGIWYFHYHGGLRGTGEDVYNTYYPAAEANKRVAAWGPLLLDRHSGGIYSTGWAIENTIAPGQAEYISYMSDDMLAGLLVNNTDYPLAMMVDKRVNKEWQTLPEREVTVSFSDRVQEIQILEGDSVVQSESGNEITFAIKAGGGQLLRLIDPLPVSLSAAPSASSDEAIELKFNGYENVSGYWIYYGTDGIDFPDSLYTQSTNPIIDGLDTGSLYFIKIRAHLNDNQLTGASEIIMATPGTALNTALVLSSQRTDFFSRHGTILHDMGYGVASASQSALEMGFIELDVYDYVDWIAGNDTLEILTGDTKQHIKTYLEGGGNLLISGANIGYALASKPNTSDKPFYWNYLKAAFLYDAPDRTESRFYALEADAGTIFEGLPPLYFDDGSQGTYDVPSPDVITGWKGSKEGLRFSGVTNLFKGACTYYAGPFGESAETGKIVNLSVPLETIYPDSARFNLYDRIFDFFDASTGIPDSENQAVPRRIILDQNFPNPFNSVTTIRYSVGMDGGATMQNFASLYDVHLNIYNIAGQRIATPVSGIREPGTYETKWNASEFPSGIYFYRLTYGSRSSEIKKLILLR